MNWNDQPARCPLTGKASGNLAWCLDYPGTLVICRDCPAWSWRLPLALAARWLRRLFWPFLAVLMLSAFMVMPVSAHDPTHDAPMMIKRVITTGKAGGVYRVTKNGLFGTWTDGTHVAILKNGQVVTFYTSRNAAQVAAKAAAEKGASLVSASAASKALSAAKKVTGTAGSNLLGLMPASVLDPTCWRGATNICLQGQRRNE